MANPNLDGGLRAELVGRLMSARRAVRAATLINNPEGGAAARRCVDEVKRALGERGPVWWDDESPDLNRRMVQNTSYADWYAGLASEPSGED